MRHRSQHKLFDRKIPISRASSTFTNKSTSNVYNASNNNNSSKIIIPHLTEFKNKLHSKSTYFYRWGSSKNTSKLSLGSSSTSSRLVYVVPSVCALALLVGGVIAINPVIATVEKVAAEDESIATIDDVDSTSSISFSIEGNLAQTTPVVAGEVAYRTNNITVTASNADKFFIMLSPINGATSELHGKNNPLATIDGVGRSVLPKDFPQNTWGYSITEDVNTSDDTLKYSSVPNYEGGAKVIASMVGLPPNSVTEKVYKLTFAAKIGNDSPADNYMSKISLSIVGDAESTATLPIETMQQMTSAVCDKRMRVGQTGRLKDSRDGKFYWVAKLADGNCWMTQNLDFDVPTNEPFETSLGNMKTIEQAGMTVITNTTVNGEPNVAGVSRWPTRNGANALAYYDPGLMLKTNPAETKYCGGSNTKLLEESEECRNAGWVDVSDQTKYTPKLTAPQSNASWDSSVTSNVLDGTTYDAHYLSGNYYSWNLATAGTGQLAAEANANKDGTQAPDSICPKGWKLPTAGNALNEYPETSIGGLRSYDVRGSFAYLVRKYGLYAEYYNSSTKAYVGSGTMTGGSYKAYDAPLYYLRSGIIDSGSSSGYIGSAGSTGRGWSSTIFNSGNAYCLGLVDNNLDPSYTNLRYLGFPIRCVHDPSI